MSDVISKYNRYTPVVDGGFAKLLRKRGAEVHLAMLSELIEHCGDSIAESSAYAAVGEMLRELELAGYDGIPMRDGVPISAAELCVEVWCGELGLLKRTIGPAGEVVFSPTAAAHGALSFVESTIEGPSQLVDTHVGEMLDRTVRFLADSTEDADMILKLAYERCERAFADYMDVLEGAYEPLSEQQRYANMALLASEMDGVVADLAQVGEYMREEEERIKNEFRRDPRPRLQIIDEYVDRLEDFKQLQAAGRSYKGVIEILFNSESRKALDDAFAKARREGTMTEQTNKLRERWSRVSAAVEKIHGLQGKSVNRIEREVKNIQSDNGRSLIRALAELRDLADAFTASRSPRDKSPLRWPTAKLSNGCVARKVAERPVPVEMLPVMRHATGSVDLSSESREWAPPKVREIIRALCDAASPADFIDLAAVFNGLPPEMRRDVDLMGVMAVGAYALSVEQGAAVYCCVDANGGEWKWRGPAILITKHQAALCLSRGEV